MQQALVDSLRANGYLRSPAVEAAFRTVPRHLFLPGTPLEDVYRDQAIITKRLDGVPISSSSQPAIMAVMLEQLDVQPGQHVLEIGAGTGYNAALLAQLVGASGQVTSMDIDPDLVDQARRNLARARLGRVQVVCGDGVLGYPEAAPYDRIILTVGAWDIAPAWWEQLRSDSRLVVPLAIRGPELSQKSIAFDRVNDHLVSASVRPCSFMRLRGPAAGPVELVPLGPEPGLHLVIDGPPPVPAETVYDWLMGPSQTRPTSVHVAPHEAFGGLNLWLALREPRFCALVGQPTTASRELVPDLYGREGTPLNTVGLLDPRGLSLLARPAGYRLPDDCDEWSEQAPRFELEVRSFGPDPWLAERVAELVSAWDHTARRGAERLRLRAYPRETEVYQPPTGQIIDKRWTRLVLDWS